MTDARKPQDLSDAALDEISGGPTEELFGAYNIHQTARHDATKKIATVTGTRGYVVTPDLQK